MNEPPPPERVAHDLEPVRLTNHERELFAYLLRVKQHAGVAVELRVCGGWVRDKLLGLASSGDVDIALDTLSGRDFAGLVNAYDVHACGQKARAVGVMRRKLEQARTVEVVTMHIGDIGRVDFAALRASLASENVSAGAEAFGTLLQDAERRDFTINSLFYNVATHEVEDLTGQGLRDLRDGVIRTPLDARKMLLDDPIRAVRAVRFAAQLGFRLEPSLLAALAQDEVRRALATSVSRRRLGQVLTQTLAGASARPRRALQLLRDLRLLEPMLLPDVPELAVVEAPDGTLVPNASAELDAVWGRSCAYALQVCDLASGGDGESERHALKLRILGALVLPFARHRVPTRDVSLPTYILRDSLKLSNQEARDVDLGILRHLDTVWELVRAEEFDRVRVGLALRSLRLHWGSCRDVALAKELVDSPERQQPQIRRRYDAFTACVVASGLDDVASWSPLLSGGELVSELKVPPGAAVKRALDEVFVWQLENPAKSRSDCLAHFRARWSPSPSSSPSAV